MNEVGIEPNRIEWVDVYKGLGIILVILGHTGISVNLNNYIYAFHMPMFFFISGYLMKKRQDYTMGKVVKKKFNSLLIPYVVFSFISIIAYVVILEGVLDSKQFIY